MTTSKVTPFRPGNKSPPHEQYYNFDKKPGNKSLDHEHNYLLEKSTNSNNEIYKEYVDINKEYYSNRGDGFFCNNETESFCHKKLNEKEKNDEFVNFDGYENIFTPNNKTKYRLERAIDHLILNPYQYQEKINLQTDMQGHFEKYEKFPYATINKIPIFQDLEFKKKEKPNMYDETDGNKDDDKKGDKDAEQIKYNISAVAYSKKHNSIAYGSHYEKEDLYKVYLLKLEGNMKEIGSNTWFDNGYKITHLFFDWNEENLVVVDLKYIHVYEISKEIGKLKASIDITSILEKYPQQSIQAISEFENGSNLIVSLKNFQFFLIHNYKEKYVIEGFKDYRYIKPEDSFVLNEEKTMFLGVNEKFLEIKFYDMKFQKKLYILKEAHFEPITSMALSKELLISGDKSNLIRVWSFIEIAEIIKEKQEKEIEKILKEKKTKNLDIDKDKTHKKGKIIQEEIQQEENINEKKIQPTMLIQIEAHFVGGILGLEIISHENMYHGKYFNIISTSSDKHIRVWKIHDRKDPKNEEFKMESLLIGNFYYKEENLKFLKCTQDQNEIIVAGKKTLRKYNLNSLEEITKGVRLHIGKVTALCLTPDGKKLISAIEDSLITVWDTNSLKRLFSFKSHASAVSCLKVMFDNKYLLSGSSDKTIKIWDIENNDENDHFCKEINGKGPITEILISKDDKWLISSGLDIKFWEIIKEKDKILDCVEKFYIKGDEINEILALSMTSDSKIVISGGTKRQTYISLWESHIHLERNDKNSDDSKEIRVIKGKPIILEKHSKSIYALAVSPDDKFLVSGSADKKIILWDLTTNTVAKEFEDQEQEINTLKYFPDGRFLISGSSDSIIRVWDMKHCNLVGKMEGHFKAIKVLAISNDGETIYTGSVDQSIREWSLNTNRGIKYLEGHSKEITCLLHIDNYIYSSSKDHTIRVWDKVSEEQKYILRGHTNEVNFLLYSPKHNILISAGDDTIRFWDIISKEELKNKIKVEAICSIDISESNDTIVLITKNQTIVKCKWNQEIKAYQKQDISFDIPHDNINILKLIGDDRMITGDFEYNLLEWNIEDGTIVVPNKFNKNHKHSDFINSIVVTDKTVITCSGEINVWDRFGLFFVYSEKKTFKSIMFKSSDVLTFFYLNDQNQIYSFKMKKDKAKKRKIFGFDKDKAINPQISQGNDIQEDKTSQDKDIQDKDNQDKDKQDKNNQDKVIYCRKILKYLVIDANLTVYSTNEKIEFARKKDKDKPLQITAPILHSDRITALEICSDSGLIISGSRDGSLILWNLPKCKALFEQKSHKDAIISITVLSNDLMISASSDNSVILWRILKRSNSDLESFYLKEISWFKKSFEQLDQEDDRNDFITSLTIYPDKKMEISYDSPNKHIKSDNHTSKFLSEKIPNILIVTYKVKMLDLWEITSDKKQKIRINYTENDNPNKSKNQKEQKLFKLNEFKQRKSLSKSKAYDKKLIFTTLSEADFDSYYPVTLISLENYIILGYSNGKIYSINLQEDFYKNLDFNSGAATTSLNAEIKFIGHKAEIVSLITSSSQSDELKLISSSLDNTIRFWNIKTGNLLQTIELGVKIDFQISKPYFLIPNRLLLINNLIYDISNEIVLFGGRHQKNVTKKNTQKIFCKKTKRFYTLDKTTGMFYESSLIDDNLLFYMMEYSKIHNFFQDLHPFKRILNGSCMLYPFYCNFLHLHATFSNNKYFMINDLDDFKDIPLETFIQKNCLNQTPISILLEKRNKAFLKGYFQAIFKSFKSSNTLFNHKLKFFEQKFTFYTTSPKEKYNIYDYMITLMKNDKKNLSIVVGIFENSLLDLEMIDMHKQIELKHPIFAITSDENKDKVEQAIKEALEKKQKNKPKQPSNSTIKAKLIALPDITDASNLYTSKFFKQMNSISYTNTIFANSNLQLITNYKWKKIYGGFYRFLLMECIFFLACFLSNFAYILPLKEESTQSVTKIISLMLDIVLMLYFFLIFYNESKKFIVLNKDYFSNIWNIVDLLLSLFVIASSILDIIHLWKVDMVMTGPKIIYSYAMLLLWVRVISFFRGFESTGFLLRLIFKVIYDIRFFLLFICIFILGFTYSAYLLQTDLNYQYNQFQVWQIFYRLILGDFNLFDDFALNDVEIFYFIWILLMFTTILTTIILLNLLISIIQNTFNKVLESEDSMKNYERLSLINDFELYLDAIHQLLHRKWFDKRKACGKYLLYIYNESKEQEQKANLDYIMSSIDNLKAGMSGLDKKINCLISSNTENKNFFNINKNEEKLGFTGIMGSIQEIKNYFTKEKNIKNE